MSSKFTDDCFAKIGIPAGYIPAHLTVEYAKLASLFDSLAMRVQLGDNLLANPTDKVREAELPVQIRNAIFTAYTAAAKKALELDVAPLAAEVKKIMAARDADPIERLVDEALATHEARKENDV